MRAPREPAVAALLCALAAGCSLLLPGESFETPGHDGSVDGRVDGDRRDADLPPPHDGAPRDAPRLDGSDTPDASDGGEPDTSHCVAEVCNGRDDDCDGMEDEDFDCPAGSERPCDVCGVAGTQICAAGCLWGECAASCPPGQPTCCWESTCVDTASDPAHCGACGQACAAGQSCCGGVCVSTDDDERNCGGCNITCDFAVTCCGGACVNTAFSKAHCGRCFNPCPGAFAYCSFGECR